MKEAIKNHLHDPKQLEQLYRANKAQFKYAFDGLYPDIQHDMVAKMWHERLHFEEGGLSWGNQKEWMTVALLSLLAGLVAKLPDLFGWEPDYFFQRNIGFVFLPMLAAYFAWKQQFAVGKIVGMMLVWLAAVVYINVLPRGAEQESSTFILACVHLPLLMWSVLGYAFVAPDVRNAQKRIEFLRYNGDLAVMSALLMIAGGILSGVTVGLFELINLQIGEFYFANIAIWGLAALPIIATFLVRTNPQLVNQVSPVIAKVFTPLVLIMLVVYLVAILYTGKDPYNDREFLIMFNLLLIGVMAIILFAITEASKKEANVWSVWLLLALSVVTIILNGIALSAIVFRISEWGFTPNRVAVLGGNLLILTNLMMVAFRLFQASKHAGQLLEVERSIAWYLPVYSIWTVIVTFLFPVLFGFN